MTHPEPVREALSRIKAAAPAAKFMTHNTERVFRDAETLAAYIESMTVPVEGGGAGGVRIEDKPVGLFAKKVVREFRV